MKSQSMTNQCMIGGEGESKKKYNLEKTKKRKKKIAIGAVILFSGLVTMIVVKKMPDFKSSNKASCIDEFLTNSIDNRSNVGHSISESFEKGVTSNLPKGKIIKVKGHVRNLSGGQNPSIIKVELAAKIGCPLKEHQTLVNPYIKAAA